MSPGPEYATMEAAIKGMMGEADSLADVHLSMKDKLQNDVAAAIKQWRSENYHKGMVGPCKETKQLEDEFKKVCNRHYFRIHLFYVVCR